jgi:hypothetical protein
METKHLSSGFQVAYIRASDVGRLAFHLIRKVVCAHVCVCMMLLAIWIWKVPNRHFQIHIANNIEMELKMPVTADVTSVASQTVLEISR